MKRAPKFKLEGASLTKTITGARARLFIDGERIGFRQSNRCTKTYKSERLQKEVDGLRRIAEKHEVKYYPPLAQHDQLEIDTEFLTHNEFREAICRTMQVPADLLPEFGTRHFSN